MNQIAALLLFVCTASSTLAAEPRFHGTWATPMCSHHSREKCGGFFLYLVQKGARICGTHSAATPGLGRLDEGMPRSVVGKVVGGVAIVSITSGRDESSYRARVERRGSRLRWKVLEKNGEGTGHNDSLIPLSMVLVREPSEDLKRVSDACS